LVVVKKGEELGHRITVQEVVESCMRTLEDKGVRSVEELLAFLVDLKAIFCEGEGMRIAAWVGELRFLVGRVPFHAYWRCLTHGENVDATTELRRELGKERGIHLAGSAGEDSAGLQ